MTLTDELAAKFETKRTGLSFDEACEAAVMGYRVRCPSLQPEAYIHYQFDGLRIQFVHNGVEGSSSGWRGDRSHMLDEWEIVSLASELQRDAWGVPIVNEEAWRIPQSDDDLATRIAKNSHFGKLVKRDSWGRPL